MSEHSPTPWKGEEDAPWYIQDAKGQWIVTARAAGEGTLAASIADGALILRAVNNHEALVEALAALTEYVEDDNPGAVKADAWVSHLIEDARAALKAVKP